jgi:hypothetical protein
MAQTVVKLKVFAVPDQHARLVEPAAYMRELCTALLQELNELLPARPGSDGQLMRRFSVPRGSRVMWILERSTRASPATFARYVTRGTHGDMQAKYDILAALRFWAESKLTTGWVQQSHYCINVHSE